FGAQPAGRRRGDCPVGGTVAGGRRDGRDRNPGRGGKPAAPFVVDHHHGGAGTAGPEKFGLGGEVVVHGAVQVQVVLGQVGEPGDVEDHPVDALEGDGVGGHFHGGRIQAALPHERQEAVHVR